MPTISVNISPKDLIETVNQLDNRDLEDFINQVLKIRAKRLSSNTKKLESELLKKINKGLPVEQIERKHRLLEKKEQFTISNHELLELQEIMVKSENIAAERLNYLAELAELRGTPVLELMQELGIQSTYYG